MFVVTRAIALFASLWALPAAAQVSGVTARQASSGSLKFLAYHQGVAEQPVDFTVAGSANCQTAGGVPFGCGQGGTVEAEGRGSAGMLKAIYQIGDYVRPYAVIGAGSYELSVPSTTVTNTLSGSAPGLIYGGGVKFSVNPDTQFAPGVALDLGYQRADYRLDHLSPRGAASPARAQQRLTLTTWQVAVEAAHQFSLENGKLEPYGGIRWIRVEADLKDIPSGTRAGGRKDSASPFLGLRVPAGERVGGFLESSFAGGYHYGAGLEYRFK